MFGLQRANNSCSRKERNRVKCRVYFFKPGKQLSRSPHSGSQQFSVQSLQGMILLESLNQSLLAGQAAPLNLLLNYGSFSPSQVLICISLIVFKISLTQPSSCKPLHLHRLYIAKRIHQIIQNEQTGSIQEAITFCSSQFRFTKKHLK